MTPAASTTAAEVEWISERPAGLDFNGPAHIPFLPYDARTSLQDRFDLIASLYPERISIDDGRSQLTYGQLQSAARALAKRLHSEVRAGTPILACFRYTVAFSVAVLACTAAGCPFIPVDLAYPLDRQRVIIDNAVAGAVLMESGTSVEAELPDIARVQFALGDLCNQDDAGWPDVRLDPDAVAGVTYTSGSTARPKGFAWSLRGFSTIMADLINTCHISVGDKIVALGSLATTGCGDCLAALLSGASLRVVNIAGLGVHDAFRILGDEKITILGFVPAVLRSIMQLDGAEQAFRHLRILDLYGDATLPSDIALFRSKLSPDCKIRICLGTMEAGSVFHWFVPSNVVLEGLKLPCGYIADGKAVALLDEKGRSVPEGQAGELVVRGRGMALGAWQNGRLTAGPFLPDPADPKSRIFPVGDLACRRSDGLFEFLGRKDRQVKVRGQRADLGEVEAALRQHPMIDDVAVVSGSDPGDAVIIAYCTSRGTGSQPEPSVLRRLVATETAEHMVPRQIHFIDRIPRLPNYKPDLVKLNALARSSKAVATT